jgi:addiction module HigA family antidote
MEVTAMYGVDVRHPGRVLSEDFLPAMGLSLAAAGKLIGVSHTTIYKLLHGQYGVSPLMALRLGKLCGTGPRFWLEIQLAYDLHALERLDSGENMHIPTMPIRLG